MGILDSIRDTLKLVKSPNKRGVQVCPKCGSLHIRPLVTGGGKGWIFPATYECDECGYAGSIVLELDQGEEYPARS